MNILASIMRISKIGILSDLQNVFFFIANKKKSKSDSERFWNRKNVPALTPLTRNEKVFYSC